MKRLREDTDVDDDEKLPRDIIINVIYNYIACNEVMTVQELATMYSLSKWIWKKFNELTEEEKPFKYINKIVQSAMIRNKKLAVENIIGQPLVSINNWCLFHLVYTQMTFINSSIKNKIKNVNFANNIHIKITRLDDISFLKLMSLEDIVDDDGNVTVTKHDIRILNIFYSKMIKKGWRLLIENNDTMPSEIYKFPFNDIKGITVYDNSCKVCVKHVPYNFNI